MDHLTEPGIKSYFKESFQQCKEYKLGYYTRVLNVGLLVLFAACLFTILYFKKKGKISPELRRKKNEEDRMYIVNRIRSLQIVKP
jgi:hypothetical protein